MTRDGSAELDMCEDKCPLIDSKNHLWYHFRVEGSTMMTLLSLPLNCCASAIPNSRKANADKSCLIQKNDEGQKRARLG